MVLWFIIRIWQRETILLWFTCCTYGELPLRKPALLRLLTAGVEGIANADYLGDIHRNLELLHDCDIRAKAKNIYGVVKPTMLPSMRPS